MEHCKISIVILSLIPKSFLNKTLEIFTQVSYNKEKKLK